MTKEEFDNLNEWVEKNTDDQQRWENGGKEIYDALKNDPNFANSPKYKEYMQKVFLLKLYHLEQMYRNEKQEAEFNIFTALHTPTDEKRLHSRFISYLLSESNHGMKEKFLELFLTLKSSENPENLFDEEFLNDFINDKVKVLPNEETKSEYENIDILIWDEQSKAIIIENKIFAGDSNHVVKEEEMPDLEKFVDVKVGDEIPQLAWYFFKLQKKLNLNNEETRKNIKLVYLKLSKQKPSYSEFFENQKIPYHCIEYRTEIRNWLEDCMKEAEKENKPLLRDSIRN